MSPKGLPLSVAFSFTYISQRFERRTFTSFSIYNLFGGAEFGILVSMKKCAVSVIILVVVIVVVGLTGAYLYVKQEIRFCCQAITAECLACSEGITVKEFCENDPTLRVCENLNEN